MTTRIQVTQMEGRVAKVHNDAGRARVVVDVINSGDSGQSVARFALVS